MRTDLMIEIEKKISDANFSKDVDRYIELKKENINRNSLENIAYIKLAYELIFSSLKIFLSKKIITQEEFWLYINELKEGF